jgi:hypothetical protein
MKREREKKDLNGRQQQRKKETRDGNSSGAVEKVQSAENELHGFKSLRLVFVSVA